MEVKSNDKLSDIMEVERDFINQLMRAGIKPASTNGLAFRALWLAKRNHLILQELITEEKQ